MARKSRRLKLPEGDIEVSAFFQEFADESDRAAAVLAGAYLDVALGRLLRANMIRSSVVDDLFAPDQALGSYSAKIRVSYTLGLISENERDDLNRIRGIRNDFAHQLHGLSFQDQSIADRCREFRMPRVMAEAGLVELQHWGSRDLFTFTFVMLNNRIKMRIANAEKQTLSPAPEIQIKTVKTGDTSISGYEVIPERT